MTPERWREVERLFAAALEKDGVEREALLEETRAVNPELAAEVCSLLSADAEGNSLLERGAPPPVEPGDALAEGETVGEYLVERKLGAGTFGTVYLARHPTIHKRACVKVLRGSFASDPNVVSRFVTEARAVNEIGHPNIIDIFGFGETADGRPYFLMEYVDGEPLDALLRREGPLGLDDARAILTGVARALDAAHQRSIVHRDLKPANVMVTRDGAGRPFAKLLDFGIAKLLEPHRPSAHRTAAGVTMGTPAYMSPEQVLGREVDHTADVYSFGVLAYEVLTGVRPFAGASAFEIMVKHAKEPPVPPSRHAPGLAGPIERWILEMLQKEPGRRPQSLGEGLAVLAGPPPSRVRRPALVVAAVLGALALVLTAARILSAPETVVPVQSLPPARAVRPAILEVVDAPPGTVILDDAGMRLGTPGAPIELPPGPERTLVFEAKGYHRLTRTVHPGSGERIVLSLSQMRRRLHDDLEDAFAP